MMGGGHRFYACYNLFPVKKVKNIQKKAKFRKNSGGRGLLFDFLTFFKEKKINET
jgi:hypothetical protein